MHLFEATISRVMCDMQDATQKQQKANADKGTKLSVLVGEGAGVFFGGETTGK